MRTFFLLLAMSIAWVFPLAGQQPVASPKSAQTPPLLTPDQDKARELVETVYNTWRLSVQRRDESGWRSCTTSSRQVKVRNLVISERGDFPNDFFRSAQSAPPLENFRYVGALGSAGGRTLAATYVGKLQLGSKAAAHQNAFVIELVQEGGRWKLDQTRFFDLSKLPAVLKRLEAKDLAVLREQDGFHPYRAIPAAPPVCPKPELIGKVFVDCPGRAIEMRINGVSIHEFDNERRADTISGGLKRGNNTISYTIRDSAFSSEKPGMGIGLFVMPEGQGKQPVCVFDHILDAAGQTNGGNFTFDITPELLAAMDPNNKATPHPFHAEPLKPREEPKTKN